MLQPGSKELADNEVWGFYTTRILRVINGSLYRDWPWDAPRFEKEWLHGMIHDLVMNVELPDVAIFWANEMHSTPFNFPLPTFSAAPSMDSSDMPWPWPAHYNTEKKPWNNRTTKCAFFGAVTEHRSPYAHLAVARPDIIHANVEMPHTGLHAINPHSQEQGVTWEPEKNWTKYADNTTPRNKYTNFGFIRDLVPLPHKFVKYKPSDYKYVAVLMGLDGKSTADRLGSLLAYSGSVILLQHSPFEYHFSHKLKPWVHYVPV
eukprot:gene29323-36352_t